MGDIVNKSPKALCHYAMALQDIALELGLDDNAIEGLIQQLLLELFKTIDIESFHTTPSQNDPTRDLHSAIKFCRTFSHATSMVLIEYLVTRLPSPTGTEAQEQLLSCRFLSTMLDYFHHTNLSMALHTFVANTLYQYARTCVGNGPPRMVDRLIQGIGCGCLPCDNLVEGLLNSNHTVEISEPSATRRHLESRLKKADSCGVTWKTDTSGKMHTLIVSRLLNIISLLYNDYFQVEKDTEMIEYGVVRKARSTARGIIKKLGMPRDVRRTLGDHYHEIFKWLRLDMPNLTPTPQPSPSPSPPRRTPPRTGRPPGAGNPAPG